MDGVSAVASVVTLVEVSLNVLSLCAEYYSNVKDAKNDIDRFCLEIETFIDILQRLQSLARNPKTEHIFKSQSLSDSIEQCRSDLQKLQQKLNPGKRRRTMSRFGIRALRWPFESKGMQEIVATLERYKSTFTAALSIDQTYVACSYLLSPAKLIEIECCCGTSTPNSI